MPSPSSAGSSAPSWLIELARSGRGGCLLSENCGSEAGMKRVCVFCGSSPGARPAYTELARRLGSILARRGMTLVYGGGNVGLMGVLANAVLAGGGNVIGVIPQAMVDLEVAHPGFPDLRIV